MIRNYLDFNIAKFVKDCYEHQKQLPALIEQYNNLDGLKGIDPSRDKVQTSPNNDAMDKLVVLRINLAERIEDYQSDINLLKTAFQCLTEDEQEAIDICFNGRPISEQCYMRNIEERTLYRHRKKALAKLTSALIGN